jgi:purine-binding chemotaxis protein CheW
MHWRGKMLLVTAGHHRVGIPLSYVRETMRPRPLEVLKDAPPAVLGLSIIRGKSVPVLDLGALIGRDGEGELQRLVTLDLGERSIALAVDSVVEVVEPDPSSLLSLPPLVARASGETLAALSVVDRELVLVLEATKLFDAVSAESIAS